MKSHPNNSNANTLSEYLHHNNISNRKTQHKQPQNTKRKTQYKQPQNTIQTTVKHNTNNRKTQYKQPHKTHHEHAYAFASGCSSSAT